MHPLYGTQRARRGPTTTTPYLGEKRLRFSETSINTRTPHSQRGRSVGPVVLPTCSSRDLVVAVLDSKAVVVVVQSCS